MEFSLTTAFITIMPQQHILENETTPKLKEQGKKSLEFTWEGKPSVNIRLRIELQREGYSSYDRNLLAVRYHERCASRGGKEQK